MTSHMAMLQHTYGSTWFHILYSWFYIQLIHAIGSRTVSHTSGSVIVFLLFVFIEPLVMHNERRDDITRFAQSVAQRLTAIEAKNPPALASLGTLPACTDDARRARDVDYAYRVPDG